LLTLLFSISHFHTYAHTVSPFLDASLDFSEDLSLRLLLDYNDDSFDHDARPEIDF